MILYSKMYLNIQNEKRINDGTFPEALSPFPLLRQSFSALSPPLLALPHFPGPEHTHPSYSFIFSFVLQEGWQLAFYVRV